MRYEVDDEYLESVRQNEKCQGALSAYDVIADAIMDIYKRYLTAHDFDRADAVWECRRAMMDLTTDDLLKIQ